ncbi:MAG: alpha/beta hydrolase [bacterium]|nr:alpha/beta hydrolase [bacterium]
MDDKLTQFFKLLDGRQICFAEYGNPKGRPLILVHGTPNSRLLWDFMLDPDSMSDLRMIAPDRPGYGQTEYVHGVTTLENWPGDLTALTDSLGLDKFAVYGASGGGPYTLACAWKIPERLTAVGVFGSVGPLTPETIQGAAGPVRALWAKAPKVPGLFKLQMRLFAWLAKRAPGLYRKMILSEFSEKDREDYERLGVGPQIQASRNEGYRQKGIGVWYDVMLPANWPIPLNEITTKVRLWHGEEDISAPLAMGRYIAEHIPDCEATFIKGAGHFWIFEHLTEMLMELASRSD